MSLSLNSKVHSIHVATIILELCKYFPVYISTMNIEIDLTFKMVTFLWKKKNWKKSWPAKYELMQWANSTRFHCDCTYFARRINTRICGWLKCRSRWNIDDDTFFALFHVVDQQSCHHCHSANICHHQTPNDILRHFAQFLWVFIHLANVVY